MKGATGRRFGRITVLRRVQKQARDHVSRVRRRAATPAPDAPHGTDTALALSPQHTGSKGPPKILSLFEFFWAAPPLLCALLQRVKDSHMAVHQDPYGGTLVCGAMQRDRIAQSPRAASDNLTERAQVVESSARAPFVVGSSTTTNAEPTSRWAAPLSVPQSRLDLSRRSTTPNDVPVPREN